MQNNYLKNNHLLIMSKIITLRKGLDINLQGKAVEKLVKLPLAPEYAVSPLDFEGVTPKLLVKAGDRVKAGTPLFFNKYNERVVFTSPVSGTVSAINRGEKRCILNVTVQADATQTYEEFAKLNVQTASREEIIDLLLKSGHDYPAALRYHRRSERHTEGRFRFDVRFRTAGSGLQFRAGR